MTGLHRPWEVFGTVDYPPEMLAVLERMAPHIIPRQADTPDIFGEPFRDDGGDETTGGHHPEPGEAA